MSDISDKIQKLYDREEKLKQELKQLKTRQKEEQKRLAKKERADRTRKLVVLGAAFEKLGIDTLINYDYETALGMLSILKDKLSSDELRNYKILGSEIIGKEKYENQSG